mmetsp:Transcript_44777/g.133745  ORF Transcript_44777/g.133745 Transcript_44777/m.133745 type:complete len:87 (-) Transcript_44777:179-439(-)
MSPPPQHTLIWVPRRLCQPERPSLPADELLSTATPLTCAVHAHRWMQRHCVAAAAEGCCKEAQGMDRWQAAGGHVHVGMCGRVGEA